MARGEKTKTPPPRRGATVRTSSIVSSTYPTIAPRTPPSPKTADFADEIGQGLLEDAAESLKILATAAREHAAASEGIPLAELGVALVNETQDLEDGPTTAEREPEEATLIAVPIDDDEVDATQAIAPEIMATASRKRRRKTSRRRLPEDERDTDDLEP